MIYVVVNFLYVELITQNGVYCLLEWTTISTQYFHTTC